MQESQDLFHEYLKAYMEVQALSGKLLSAKSELARRAKMLCETYGEVAKGKPILVNSPIGILSFTLTEDDREYPKHNYADLVEFEHLQSIQQLERELADHKESLGNLL